MELFLYLLIGFIVACVIIVKAPPQEDKNRIILGVVCVGLTLMWPMIVAGLIVGAVLWTLGFLMQELKDRW